MSAKNTFTPFRMKTWLTTKITPYQLYLKLLYEYFNDELNQTDDVFIKYLPQEFKNLEYQKTSGSKR